MADTKLSELSAIGSVSDEDLIYVVDDPGGTPVSKKATASQVLAPAAKTGTSNTFTGDQTVNGDLIVTGEINPARYAAQRPKINALAGEGVRTLLSETLEAGMSLRHDEAAHVGKVTVGNYDTATYEPLMLEADSLRIVTGTDPPGLVEHLRVHPSGGVTVGTIHTTDPGSGVLVAQNGLGTTPLPPYADYAEGIPANPPADKARLYAVDTNGVTLLEVRDSAGRTLRLNRDTVAVGKVDEPGGITRGAVVYVSGATGTARLLKKAVASSRATTPGLGLAMETGAQNAFIRVLTSGLLSGLNTSAIAEGARVFLSATTAGEVTPTAPTAPNLIQRMGYVLRQHASQGEIGVLPATALSEAGWALTHASMHGAGGRDPLPLDALAAPQDTTTLNATTAAHGLLPKLSGAALQFLSGDGTWRIPITQAQLDAVATEVAALRAEVTRLKALIPGA